MAKICAKHDVIGDECWCCEEEKLNATPGARAKAYSDPAFLQKRGGLSAATALQATVVGKLSQLSPEALDKLLALAGVAPAAAASSGSTATPSARRVFA